MKAISLLLIFALICVIQNYTSSLITIEKFNSCVFEKKDLTINTNYYAFCFPYDMMHDWKAEIWASNSFYGFYKLFTAEPKDSDISVLNNLNEMTVLANQPYHEDLYPQYNSYTKLSLKMAVDSFWVCMYIKPAYLNTIFWVKGSSSYLYLSLVGLIVGFLSLF